MNKVKKLMAGVLSAAVLSAAPMSAWANASPQVIPISAPMPTEEQKVNYMSFSGVVKEINVSRNMQYVLVEDADGQLVNFLVAEDTVFVTDTPLKVGARVTGYYNADLPMIMIYPMQPKAEVMAVELPEGHNIKIDKFDEDLLSYDKELKLNISPETIVLLRDGSKFTGELTGRKLVVMYTFIMKSLPPQTAPTMVIVLDEQEAPAPQEREFNYLSVSGIVKEINVSNNWRYVLVEGVDGQLVNFLVAEDTVFLTDKPLQVGAKVTGYYDANLPMIMIYPMQPKAEVMAVELPEEQSIKIDRFDVDLLSYDKGLKLNVSPETNIVLQDGSKFTGELAGRKLVVLYSFTTRSIPPQTSPVKIVVLSEKEELGQGEVTSPNQNSIREIVVENVRIEAPAPFINESGVTMVPLRGIAEALGYAVGWDDATESVTLGSDISLTIGKDSYTTQKGQSISIGTAPIIVEGRTFVPLSFFKEVVSMNNAYVFEGQVVIDNGEKMN